MLLVCALANMAVAIILQSDLIQRLTAWRWVFARDAGLAQLRSIQANRPRDGRDWKISQRVRPERVGHIFLHRVRKIAASVHEFGGEEFSMVDMSMP